MTIADDIIKLNRKEKKTKFNQSRGKVVNRGRGRGGNRGRGQLQGTIKGDGQISGVKPGGRGRGRGMKAAVRGGGMKAAVRGGSQRRMQFNTSRSNMSMNSRSSMRGANNAVVSQRQGRGRGRGRGKPINNNGPNNQKLLQTKASAIFEYHSVINYFVFNACFYFL